MTEETQQINRFTAPDFSPFRFIPAGEVPTTHLLAFFLDPKGEHGQSDLFQELLIARLRGLTPVARLLPATRWQVLAERRFPDVGQIDLLLTATGPVTFSICIENKPREQTTDQDEQLTRYRCHQRQHHPENYLLLYLSRTARLPAEHSLPTKLREELEVSGHYANITYTDFLLPLLNDWRRAAKPPHLRRFLRELRHHLEQWLQLPSTKPTGLMKEAAIANELQASPESIAAGFDIADALPTLRRNLLARFMQAMPGPGLVGSVHWKWSGFKDGASGHPFLIRRGQQEDTPSELTSWPWGRYAIALEFSGSRLFYGIRHDTKEWLRPDEAEQRFTPEEVQPLAELLGEAVDEKHYWWLWWKWAGPTTDREFCLAVADGSLVAFLQPEITRLAHALDKFCQSKPLADAS